MCRPVVCVFRAVWPLWADGDVCGSLVLEGELAGVAAGEDLLQRQEKGGEMISKPGHKVDIAWASLICRF